MCLLRWMGVTLEPLTTVMRISARWPCTVCPPKTPGPSKRTSFLASLLLTYSFPVAGLVTMLNSVVPTCANDAVCVSALASTAKTSVSGRLKRTALSQLRCSSSSQCPVLLLNLTINATYGACLPSKLVVGPGLPPGEMEPLGLMQGSLGLKPGHTRGSSMTVLWL